MPPLRLALVICITGLFSLIGCDRTSSSPSNSQRRFPQNQKLGTSTSATEENTAAVTGTAVGHPKENSSDGVPKSLESVGSTVEFKGLLESLFLIKGWDCLNEAMISASKLENKYKNANYEYQSIIGEWAAEKYAISTPKPDLNRIFEALASGTSIDAQKFPAQPGNAFLFKAIELPSEARSIFEYYLKNPYPNTLVASIDNVAGAVAGHDGWLPTIAEIAKAASPQVKDSFTGAVIDSWINHEPEAASKWIKSLPDGDMRGNAVRILVLQLARDGDFEAARAWMPYGRPDRVTEMNGVIEMYEQKATSQKQ